MPDLRRRKCQHCGGDHATVGVISWAGFCRPCAKARVAENVEGLADPGSPAAAIAVPRWRVGMIRCAGGIVPERLLAAAPAALDNAAGSGDSSR